MVQHYATSNTFYDGERGAVMPRLHPNYIYMPSSSIHATSIKYLVRGFMPNTHIWHKSSRVLFKKISLFIILIKIY